ncbi:methyltransferase [Actinomadura rubrobrunea]|uniref:Methyltransferase n=1 Tax=Actinomadura rubrobrunea TaxID=115335 RepID=A0A9W6PVX0_9ACTN|nr:class I SAM-dependent methyltransferase [Actinomadura rubrobrunea]GLW63893.1 methyltransferase [Actinomadura rubrobrunea]
MGVKNRARLSYKLGYAARNPHRIVPYARRLARDAWLRARARDHVSFYRAVMRSDTARSPYGAVGAASRAHWERIGRLQFDYLTGHGLTPGDRMLEIGCGNLRAGRLFIRYLEPGHYYGVDISPDILLAAQDTIVRDGLQDRLPHLTLVRDLRLDFLPEAYFTVVHAHSVFSHSPIQVIDECLANVGRVLAPGGFFDFTFNRTEGEEHNVLREDFYYRTDTLITLAAKHGLTAHLMDDWERTGHRQSKLRVTHAHPDT